MEDQTSKISTLKNFSSSSSAMGGLRSCSHRHSEHKWVEWEEVVVGVEAATELIHSKRCLNKRWVVCKEVAAAEAVEECRCRVECISCSLEDLWVVEWVKAGAVDSPSNNSKQGLNSADVSNNSESLKKRQKMLGMGLLSRMRQMTLHKHFSAASTKEPLMETEQDKRHNSKPILHGRERSYALSAVVAASVCSFSPPT